MTFTVKTLNILLVLRYRNFKAHFVQMLVFHG